MNFENPLENRKNLSREKNIEKDQEKIQSIEQSTILEIEKKLDLIVFALGEKKCCFLGDSKIIESQEEEQKFREEFSTELEEIKKIFDILNIPYAITEELKLREGILNFNIVAGKTREDLDIFLKAEKEKDDKTMGLLLGYPKTAIEAYDSKESLDLEKFFLELPENEQKKLEDEGVLKFLGFMPSQKHWQEELEEVRKLQALIKEKAPQLYEEIMQSENVYTVEYQKKKAKIEQIQQEVEKCVDKLGKGIDENIKDTVIFLNALDLPTSDSCEGHIKRGLAVPYVEIKALNEPRERFIGESQTFAKVAQKYNISIDEAKSAKIDKAYWEAMKECSGKGETEEYKRWDEENKKLMKKASELLGEFYKDREVKPNIKLQIDEQVAGFRIHNGGEDYQPVIEEEKEFSEIEKRERAEKVKKYRAEMDKFTKFLIDKYFKRS